MNPQITLPIFGVPEGESEVSFFEKEVRRDSKSAIPAVYPDRVKEQAEYEIGVISQIGVFASYFLVVADFINWAKSRGIRVGPGRGSGAARWLPLPCCMLPKSGLQSPREEN